MNMACPHCGLTLRMTEDDFREFITATKSMGRAMDITTCPQCERILEITNDGLAALPPGHEMHIDLNMPKDVAAAMQDVADYAGVPASIDIAIPKRN